jgi:hypothetical protein
VKNFPLEKVHEAIQEYNKVGGGHKVRRTIRSLPAWQLGVISHPWKNCGVRLMTSRSSGQLRKMWLLLCGTLCTHLALSQNMFDSHLTRQRALVQIFLEGWMAGQNGDHTPAAMKRHRQKQTPHGDDHSLLSAAAVGVH